MICELNSTYLSALLNSEYNFLVFENYGFDSEKKSVILITPFQDLEVANAFFDNSKRFYNLIKTRDLKLNQLLGRSHVPFYIYIPNFVSA